MIAVTGGMGYIGSHTCVALIERGYDVLILDDLSNSYPQVLDGIEKITGKRPSFIQLDVCDIKALEQALLQHPVTAFIHFAAFKAVGESVENPLAYYRNNLVSVIHILELMDRLHIRDLIFSSSCTVYGEPDTLPVTEAHPIKNANSPYGNTKQVGEEMITDVVRSGSSRIRSVLLRYFNPVGAHPSAEIGEIPQGIPNNLMPYLTQTAVGIRSELRIFGQDYPTPDGTAIRDYIHVMDLAEAHVMALEALKNDEGSAPKVYNVGTGTGYSVLDVIHAFEKGTGIKVPYIFAPRRAGDVTAIYADPSLIQEELGWKARYTLEDMMRTAWNWEKRYNEHLKWHTRP